MLVLKVDKGRLSSGAVSVRVVLRPNDGGAEVELVPSVLVGPKDGEHKGECSTGQPGTCAIVFSNSSSVWSR